MIGIHLNILRNTKFFIVVFTLVLLHINSWAQSKTYLKNYRTYEMSNHLGNVIETVSDKPNYTTTGLVASTNSYSDYYPYGMQLVGRNESTPNYRYGFQGQEKDDEIKGSGNSINYKFRMHDPRVGRFFAVDPLSHKFPFYSSYQFSSNSPIYTVELEGAETKWRINYSEVSVIITKGKFGNLHISYDDYKKVPLRKQINTSLGSSSGNDNIVLGEFLNVIIDDHSNVNTNLKGTSAKIMLPTEKIVSDEVQQTTMSQEEPKTDSKTDYEVVSRGEGNDYQANCLNGNGFYYDKALFKYGTLLNKVVEEAKANTKKGQYAEIKVTVSGMNKHVRKEMMGKMEAYAKAYDVTDGGTSGSNDGLDFTVSYEIKGLKKEDDSSVKPDDSAKSKDGKPQQSGRPVVEVIE